jgi:hypothetical protein
LILSASIKTSAPLREFVCVVKIGWPKKRYELKNLASRGVASAFSGAISAADQGIGIFTMIGLKSNT